MTVEQYVAYFETFYKAPFLVAREVELCGRQFALSARYEIAGEKPLVFGFGKIAAQRVSELVLFETPKCVDEDYVVSAAQLAEKLEKALVRPGEDHLATMLTLVAVAPIQAKREIKRLTWGKTYQHGEHGRYQLRLICVDPAEKTVITNSAGKDVLDRFRAPLRGRG